MLLSDQEKKVVSFLKGSSREVKEEFFRKHKGSREWFARHDLEEFCHLMQTQISSSPYLCPPFIQDVIGTLEKLERREMSRAMYNLAPRLGKSLTISTFYPMWYLGRNPSHHILFVTYAQKFAEDNFGRTIRNVMNTELFQRIFPDCVPCKDSQSKATIATEKYGKYQAVGAGGQITGKTAHLIIYDDLIKGREEANNAEMRDKLWQWYKSDLASRREPNCVEIAVGTRWHADDILGRLIGEDPNNLWNLVKFKAIDDNGNALFPERYSLEQMMRIREEQGEKNWMSLYQQEPTIAEGAIVKRDWIQTYETLPEIKSYSWTVDMAVKAGTQNDYSVAQLWGNTDNGYYLISQYRDKVDYPAFKRKFLQLVKDRPANEVLIEDTASGQVLIQELKEQTQLPIIPMKIVQNRSKEERFIGVSALFEAGRVFFPAQAHYLNDLINEVCGFPDMKHDDMVDAMVHYLTRRLMFRNTKKSAIIAPINAYDEGDDPWLHQRFFNN